MKEISKILILGGPGSGKTTLAEKLSRIYDLPIINLDSICYKPNWVPLEKNKRDEIILEKMKEKEWIMEGIYKTTLFQRANEAELIVFLDYPTYFLLHRVVKRFLFNFRKEKEEIKGCKERLTFKFLKYTLKFNSKKKEIFEILNKSKDIDKKLIIIKKGKII